ncbi:glycoside hydrolase family 3 C-terminal domain-containing protein [Actinoplanes sp. TRM 88003]|uniref:Glycoside hydrolase family 3 C-terminal domain-containing protein n=1 Tax=Paractinoplanes aksuensis TaxID=2939490 RepID=A0ABT1DKK5_9ACTN|nr:glycoside hydrolase family 3 C-terminal domain-containing protein [Actinoplanes aksuensis]MCO8271335.1 glycoside hydrolase family 3 C-terminal domain-containing protein [Actinoplanes aksuensis]
MTSDLAALVKSLDLRAKVRLLTGASTFTLADEPSIGLHAMSFSDGPTGVRGLKFTGGRVATLFPNATLLASAWDEQSAYEVGRLLAEEALAQRIHVVLGPTINLHRTALGGRLFEAYSEDPLLTGKLAAAYVRGMQDNGVGACLKHLVANESETDRNTVDSVVDDKTLHELYLLPFEIAVDDADAWSIMGAYNDVNGVASTENDHINNEVVKGAWGYQGLIMSDWFATKTVAPAANGGLDLVMPGPGGPWGDALVAAVEAGEVDEAVIDDHVTRLLRLAERVGALGTPREYPADLPVPSSLVRREQLTRLAARGMTVLKNDHDLLPLDSSTAVALIGRHAVDTITMGGGSAVVNPPYQVSVAEGLGARLGNRVTVIDGVDVRTRPVPARGGFLTAPSNGQPGIDVILYDAAGGELERRFCALAKTMIGMDDDFTGTVASARLVADVHSDGPAELGVMGVGDWTLSDGRAFPLRASGHGIGEEVLTPPTRTVVPSSAPSRFEAEVKINDMGLYGLIGHAAARETVDVIDDAVRAAAGADVAVVVVGLTEEQETESVDKTTLRLPGAQDALVEAVAGAARRTVVIVNAATPVLMPWLPRVDAVLWAGLPGQEGGHAVAAALLGDIEPAGRLVTTFPAADEAAPAWSVTPVEGRLAYDEGTFIGYRGHFAARAPEPAFWLGHGLGYGEWRYTDVRLVTGDAPSVSVTVTNVGRHESREVVQVYLRPVEPDEPVRLVGWTAVTVEPGQSARVTVRTDRRLWRRWDTTAQTWSDRLADGGEFLVARGLGDIRATVS